VTTAEAITTMTASALLILGMVYRGISRIIKAVKTLLDELKLNTQAIQNVGSTLDGSIKTVHETLQNHESRITVLESR
jgi:phage-related minor tail protein